jgi:xylulokinase
MSPSELILAVDLGTSGARAGAFDSVGRLVERAEVSYPTARPRPGWVEQDPSDWWGACQRVIGEVTARIEPGCVRAICAVGSAPATTCVDRDGRSVRPSPIWSDTRARGVSAALAQRLRPDPVPIWLPQLAWMREHEPDSHRHTRWALQSYEYIGFRLTGTATAITSVPEARPAGRVLEAVGLNPALRPETVCRPGDLIGALAPQVARELGLPAGLPVIAGTVDCFATWIGTGTQRAGTLCVTTGTSGGVAIVCDRRIVDPRGRVGSMPHVIGEKWVMAGPMSSGGNVVAWFARQFYGDHHDGIRALSHDAASIAAGADGLIALPYLSGERAPIDNPQARAVFFGIGEAHTRAHFARAVLESVAFAVLDVCEVICEAGARIDEVRLAGPAAHNSAWSQIRADVHGRPVKIPDVADSSLMGAAILAALGAGMFDDALAAIEAMVRIKDVVEPDERAHAAYRSRLPLFRELYHRLIPLFRDHESAMTSAFSSSYDQERSQR